MSNLTADQQRELSQKKIGTFFGKNDCQTCGGDGIIEEMGDGENFEYDVIAEHQCPDCQGKLKELEEEQERDHRQILKENNCLA